MRHVHVTCHVLCHVLAKMAANAKKKDIDEAKELLTRKQAEKGMSPEREAPRPWFGGGPRCRPKLRGLGIGHAP